MILTRYPKKAIKVDETLILTSYVKTSHMSFNWEFYYIEVSIFNFYVT